MSQLNLIYVTRGEEEKHFSLCENYFCGFLTIYHILLASFSAKKIRQFILLKFKQNINFQIITSYKLSFQLSSQVSPSPCAQFKLSCFVCSNFIDSAWTTTTVFKKR